MDGDRGRDSRARRRWDQRARVRAIAGGVDAVDARRLGGVDDDGAVVAQRTAERPREVRAQLPADMEEQRVAIERLPALEPDAAQTAVRAVEGDDRRLDDPDSA